MTSARDELLKLCADESDIFLSLLKTTIEGPNPEWTEPLRE